MSTNVGHLKGVSSAARSGLLKDRSSVLPKMKRQKVTKELLDQDEDVFVSKNSHEKGLQQYFTPLRIGRFMHEAMGTKEGVVVDLTAGTGNLLESFTECECLGVELDKSNIPKVKSNMLIANANLPELYPYLLQVEFQANAMVLNPPFNLFWKCAALTGSDEKNIESQRATILMAMSLLTNSGQGSFVAEKSTWLNSLSQDKKIRSRVYSVITARNMFVPFSEIECVIAFFTNEELEGVEYDEQAIMDMKSPNFENATKVCTGIVAQARRDNGLYPSLFVNFEVIDDNKKRFAAAVGEYKEKKKKAAKQTYNIDFASGKINVHISNYVQFVMHRDYDFQERELIEGMRGVSPSYFAFNNQARKLLYEMVDTKTLITMSPTARHAIEKAVIDAEFILTPMYPLKPQQRLGYLEDISQIQCTKEIIIRGGRSPVIFEKGKPYDVHVTTTTVQSHYEKVDSGPRGISKEMVKIGKALSIEIGGITFTESAEDIQTIIDHFDIPDPKDVRVKKPALYQKIKKRLMSDEFKAFTLKPFQVEDLTRAAMKDSCVLSWEMGLGKTRGAMAWAKVRNAKKTLIICPQDLKKQWFEEAHSLNIHLQEITGYSDIQEIKKAESGTYFIHYELLKGSRIHDEYEIEYKRGMAKTDDDDIVSLVAMCPKCRAMRGDGWTGKSCKHCGYVVWKKRKKGMYSYLKKCFDTIIVDEGVKIKSKHSMQGIAVRALRAKNRLLLSGSPIKGWISDSYWLLHWTLGNAVPRFPYHYEGGTERFLNDFGVFEQAAEEFRKSLSTGKKKLLPEIGNLHLLWKLFAPAIVRRTKADCGVELVLKNVHRIKVNFTTEQKKVYDWWIANFSEWFKASHVTEMDEGGVAMKEMILGLLWKLRITATVPASNLLPGVPMAGMEDSFFLGAQGKSNYTEKALFVLSKAKDVVDAGEQLVVFSSLSDNTHYLKDLLGRFGITSEIVNAETTPKKRGLLVHDFKKKKFPVLIAGTQAMSLGHSLDNANHVIMTDFEWDHSTTRQAIDRVHRFTSKKDVNVYMLYTEGGIDQKQLFEIIDLKGKSSDLALDGKLIDQNETQVDFFKMAREIINAHQMGTDGLLDEKDIERQMVEMFRMNIAAEIGEDMVEVTDLGSPLVLIRKAVRPQRIIARSQIDFF